MRLWELFDPPSVNIEERLRNSIENALIPLAAQGVPYTTVDAVIDNLSGHEEKSLGVRIDRALVMKVLDPNKTGIIKKVEGDRVYFTLPQPKNTAKSDQDQEKDKDDVKKTAVAQAKKRVQAK